MEIHSRTTEWGSALLAPTGPLVIGRDSRRLEWLISELVNTGQRRIILDLTEVPYLDSVGVGVVVSSMSKAVRGGGQLRIAGACQFILHVFNKTGVNRILHLDPTVEAAEQALDAN